MKFHFLAMLSVAAFGLANGFATPAQAEIIKSSDNGFITRDERVVEADIKATWLALTSPADWWSAQHTWSADSANLRLTPQAGGCFCEKIPEVDEPGRFTLEGSVEHMRVIQAYPESALRMVGALGPLQSEPVIGVLTIALTEVDTPQGKGTRIVWEYNVGGSMRYEVAVISKAVDGVMSLQLAGLAELLGEIQMPEDDAEAGVQLEAEESEEPVSTESEADAEAIIEPEATLDDQESEVKGPSVDEAFEDLSDPGTSEAI